MTTVCFMHVYPSISSIVQLVFIRLYICNTVNLPSNQTTVHLFLSLSNLLHRFEQVHHSSTISRLYITDSVKGRQCREEIKMEGGG
jgi:hypothetical protein